MAHSKSEVAILLSELDLGSSVAEKDDLLETARVETSAFTDLYSDRVDLIPGTKGSGKSALYRIFVDFLAHTLLQARKVVIAHGVQRHGDSVFLVYKDHFDKLSEDDFACFWCIYLVSLAHEQFVKAQKYATHLAGCASEVNQFRRACQRCGIPEIRGPRSLKDVLGWALSVLQVFRPKLTFRPAGDSGEFGLTLFPDVVPPERAGDSEDAACAIPQYIDDVKLALEAILDKAELNLWLMIDRLDEIFPRRSEVETRALRGLLRTMRVFESPTIRIKVFLRDDILDQVTAGAQGFTALTHITARQADTLRWGEDQILTMVVKRIFAKESLRTYLGIDPDKLEASGTYRQQAFYKVFPQKVHSGANQSPTLRWICNHCADGKGVVTPRDVIVLLTKAKQHQQSEFQADSSGDTEWIIGPAAIKYGLTELSKHKREKFLKAEFPHLWPHIKKFERKKTEYSESAMRTILGRNWQAHAEDLEAIGLLKRTTGSGQLAYKVPFLYRDGLLLTQGRME